jgi:hypothetical protein
VGLAPTIHFKQLIMELSIIIAIIWAHFIGDFILQSDYHAVNKSKNNKALLDHIMWYSLPFVVLTIITPATVLWLIFNVIAHGAIDWITSRISSRLWQQNKKHWFFVTIGADQSLHFTCLFASYVWLVN